MRSLFLETLGMLEAAFRRLERQVPRPQYIDVNGEKVWRFVEQTPQQAVLQKLARYISGLFATDVLLSAGAIQEQMALQRVLDEIGEDIIFLCMALCKNELTEAHKRYLQEFWIEEFDDADPLKSTQKRGMVPRKSIRTYCAQAGKMVNPYMWHNSSQTVYKTFSGYVHAASPQIMDMVSGNTDGEAMFHLRGMAGTPRVREGMVSAWNNFLRGIMACEAAAKAFGDAKLVSALRSAFDEFERTDPGTS